MKLKINYKILFLYSALFTFIASSCAPATAGEPWSNMTDEEWYAQFEGLPNCPCKLDGFYSGSPLNSRDLGGEWQVPKPASQKYHPGAVSEMRWLRHGTGNGQQCMFDSDNKLITWGVAAGTPDIYGPNNPVAIFEHWRKDVRPFEALPLETYLQRWPPNQGADESGNSCPVNPPISN